MLNKEQILIKASQYLGFDLKKFGIKRTPEKTRLFKHQASNEVIQHRKNKIIQKIMKLKLNKNIEIIFSEFLMHYDYISQELNNNIDKDEEKMVDWLLLKFFVIPFFAVRLSEEFAHYNNRINIGMTGSDFWYLPSFDTQTNKIKFPLNKIIDWLIDLDGSSNYKFYLNASADIKSDNTLKKWHKDFVLPDYENINALSAHKFIYNGTIQLDYTLSLNTQYVSVLDFLKSKDITAEQLKLEIPNVNNLVERAYENSLKDEEKKKFIRYVTQRWDKPSEDMIKNVLLTARVTQACYKELLNYFDISMNDSKSYIKNFILQLTDLFGFIYNQSLNRDTAPNADYFDLYINNINLLNVDTQAALDSIVSEILFDLHHPISRYRIDEILFTKIIDENNFLLSIENIKNRLLTQEDRYKQQSKIYDALNFIRSCAIYDFEQKLNYIYSIKDPMVLRNLGDYFSGKNYLTNEIEPMVDIDLALDIRIYIYKKFNNFTEKKIAYFGIVNLFTFPYYPKRLSEQYTQEWLDQNNQFIDSNNDREKLIFLAYRIYHEINKNNNKKVIALTEQYIQSTINLKPEEYNPQVLHVVQKYMEYIKDEKLREKLEKINEKNPQDNLLPQDGKFYFYK